MKLTTIIFVLTSTILMPTNILAASHCRKDETVFFSCNIKSTSKIASLCGNIQNSNEWLQFRLGPINKPYLIYPESKIDSLSKFIGNLNYHNDASYGGLSSSEAEVIFYSDGMNFSITRNTYGKSSYYNMSTQPGKGDLAEIGGGNWNSLNCIKGNGDLDPVSKLLQEKNLP